MTDWNPDIIANLLADAGEIATRHIHAPQREAKDDGTLVTIADRAIEALFAEHFDRPAEGSRLIGEETVASRSADYLDAALRETAWIVDPIDGTACYAHQLPIWGISIGFARHGTLEEGAIYLPPTGELLISRGPEVCYSRLRDGRFDPLAPITDPLPPYAPTGLVALTQRVGKQGSVDLPNPIHVLCCAVVPLAGLVLGRYTGYVGHLKLWDLAGGLPLLLKRGIRATPLGCGPPLDARIDPNQYYLEHGHPRCWQLRHTYLFAAPEVSDRLLPHISTC